MFWNLNFTIIPAIHVIKISYHQRKVLPKNFRKTFWPNSFFGLHFLHLIIWLMELWLNNHCQYNTPACQNKLMKISLILLAYKLTLWIRKNRTRPLVFKLILFLKMSLSIFSIIIIQLLKDGADWSYIALMSWSSLAGHFFSIFDLMYSLEIFSEIGRGQTKIDGASKRFSIAAQWQELSYLNAQPTPQTKQ